MRKKLFILLLLLVVLRELGYINLHYYRSSIGKNVTSNWSTNTTRFNADGRVSGNSSGNGQIVEIPVRVVYRGDILYEDPSSGVIAVVNISSLNNGFLWVPLYKTAGFSAYANVMHEGAFDGLYWDGKWVDQLSLSGSHSLSGNIAISGICSRHTAVGLVRQAMVKDFAGPNKAVFCKPPFWVINPCLLACLIASTIPLSFFEAPKLFAFGISWLIKGRAPGDKGEI